jgi:hypothetical protein
MRVRGLLGASALGAVIAAAAAAFSGCSAAHDAATGFTAPLSALPATDAAVEQNVQSAVTNVQAAEGAGGLAPGAGQGFVSGPSSTPTETSLAQPSPGVAVVAVYNDVTRDCLGAVVLSGAPAAPVLGESAAGTYWFVARHTVQGGCAASAFAAQSAVPSGWPAGDPSSNGFPGA